MSDIKMPDLSECPHCQHSLLLHRIAIPLKSVSKPLHYPIYQCVFLATVDPRDLLCPILEEDLCGCLYGMDIYE